MCRVLYFPCRGYIQMRLCPLKGTDDAAERAGLTGACLLRYTLKLKGSNENKLWLYRGTPGESWSCGDDKRQQADVLLHGCAAACPGLAVR